MRFPVSIWARILTYTTPHSVARVAAACHASCAAARAYAASLHPYARARLPIFRPCAGSPHGYCVLSPRKRLGTCGACDAESCGAHMEVSSFLANGPFCTACTELGAPLLAALHTTMSAKAFSPEQVGLYKAGTLAVARSRVTRYLGSPLPSCTRWSGELCITTRYDARAAANFVSVFRR